MAKKVYKQKCFSVITKNLVTFFERWDGVKD